MIERDPEKGDAEKTPTADRESSDITCESPVTPDKKEPSDNPKPLTDAVAVTSSNQVDTEIAATKVPRRERRGLLAQFALLPEVDEPKNYSRRKKWIITFIVAIAAAAAPIGSGLLLREYQQM